jgi:hypothetical protein
MDKVIQQYKKFSSTARKMVYNKKLKKPTTTTKKNGTERWTPKKAHRSGYQLTAAVHVIAPVLASSSMLIKQSSVSKDELVMYLYVVLRMSMVRNFIMIIMACSRAL